jgi:hypothetical protein
LMLVNLALSELVERPRHKYVTIFKWAHRR